MTCNYLVQAQLHTLALFDKWAVKIIIEQLRYNSNKEVKKGFGDANEVLVECVEVGSNFPSSVALRAG